jgi:8-oxo-dGTP diphosphatase
MTKVKIDVVVALLRDASDRILITQRPLSKPLGGLWEFPGGKVEAGEEMEQALYREIDEEVGLKIQQPRFIKHFSGEPFGDVLPQLHVFLVTNWFGEAQRQENQLGLAWVHVNELNQYAFPPANHAILEMLLNE